MKALESKFFQAFTAEVFKTLKADEAMSINMSAEDTLFARFSRARVRQVTEVEQAYLNIKFNKGNKTQALYLKYTGDLEVDLNFTLSKINEARTDFEVIPDDPFIVHPQNLGNTFQESVHAELSGEDMMVAVSEVAKEVDLAGLLTAGYVVRASNNSKGQSHWFKTQSFVLDYSLYNPRQKAVKALYAGTTFHLDELEKNISEAKHKLSLMNKEPMKIPRGAYRIYLAPSAVAELTGMMSWGGVSMSAHQRGAGSFMDLWKGKKSLSPMFTLKEDFSINMTPRFNDLGEAANTELTLIENGTFKNFLTSTRTANEYKVSSNFASDWESMRSAVIHPGNILEDDVLKTIGDGLYISDLHYLNWSDRDSARVTGMTRYACFKVENGQLVSPIEDLRFDESLYQIFGDGLVGLTKEAHIIPSTGSYFEREIGGVSVPGIVVDNFKFTL